MKYRPDSLGPYYVTYSKLATSNPAIPLSVYTVPLHFVIDGNSIIFNHLDNDKEFYIVLFPSHFSEITFGKRTQRVYKIYYPLCSYQNSKSLIDGLTLFTHQVNLFLNYTMTILPKESIELKSTSIAKETMRHCMADYHIY